MIPGGPLSRHMFVCSLLNFVLCSILFGTLKAAPDRDLVLIECGSLTYVVYAIIFIRSNCLPGIVIICAVFKHLTRYAFMMEAFCITATLCMELIISATQLTRFSCYQSLKTDPDVGTAIFSHAMLFIIIADTLQLVYFVCSREITTPLNTTAGDEEIELLLQEIENTPITAADDDEEAMTRKKPTKPAAIAPGLGRIEGT